ncbi:MAG: calcium-binding protein, partial [Planctomycetes bacterium]|nr:calcium-binding protein [Planctomycetota bacterium]
TGGAGDDTFAFGADTPLGSDKIDESAGGIDTLDFTRTLLTGVVINLGQSTAQVVNANLTLTLGSATTIENVYGTSQSDTITGNTLNNVLSGFGNNDSLDGGAGNDTLNGGSGNDRLIGGAGNDFLSGGTGDDQYQFTPSVALGTDQIFELANQGNDTLDFSAATAALTVDLSNPGTQIVTANLSIAFVGAPNEVENVTGGSGNDTLTGNAVNNIIVGGGGNDTLQGGAGNDLLIGGTGNDTYLFAADSQLGSDTLDESGGGIDTVSFQNTQLNNISIDLARPDAQVVNSNLTLTLGSGTTFENATGGAQNDYLGGNALNNTLSGLAGYDRFEGRAGNDTLIGGSENDVYSFNTDTPLGSDTINETGGGFDVLDFTSTLTMGVSVNLGVATAQVVNANLTLTLGSTTTIEEVDGSAQNDTITGNSLQNYLLGYSGNDTLNGGAGVDYIWGGDGNDTLIGGAGSDVLSGDLGDDVYQFNPSSALGTDTLWEATASGTDTLDFSAATAAINVNLSTTAIQAVTANLSLQIDADLSEFENVVGGSSNDTITGNALNNVLIGGAGNDTLSGLGGRDILVGGTGADTLKGGDGDDILISGTWSYYNESTKALSKPALLFVMAEWARTDASYLTRIGHLRTGGGLNGSFLLDSTTVLTDGTAIDNLVGENNQDWFWSFGSDKINDRNLGGTETVN